MTFIKSRFMFVTAITESKKCKNIYKILIFFILQIELFVFSDHEGKCDVKCEMQCRLIIDHHQKHFESINFVNAIHD